MANRAYLYSASADYKKLRDVSEMRSEIPLQYKILLGPGAALAASRIWDYEHPIGIQGHFAQGLQRWYDLLEYLQTQEGFDREKLAGYAAATRAFFEQHPDRLGELFFMEGGEVYDLMADIRPIEEQNQNMLEEIVRLSNDIELVLAQKPADVSTLVDAPWLRSLRNDITQLEPYWTHVTYFSFNKSGTTQE